jgi:hypothetical protein
MAIGSFVTPERIDSLVNLVSSPAQLLRDTRGVEVQCRAAGKCQVVTRRKPSICLNLFVNGARIEGELDDNVDLSEIYAMEVYERPVIVPSEFQGKLPTKTGNGRNLSPRSGCGAIAVWTKGRVAR